MKGTMRLLPDGTLAGLVVDTLGYVQRITGTPAPGGGWTLAVCHSVDDVLAALAGWGVPLRPCVLL